jgi:hypothetical protein
MKSRFKRFSPEWWAWMTVPEPNTGCLLWLGAVCKSGYGRIASSSGGSPVLAHRIAYECAHGPIGRRHLCHRCDTPSCVNPEHLFVGTQRDNIRDMFRKGRARPRGVQVSAPVTARELSSANSYSGVRIVDDLHLIRTNASVARWRHVTGVEARPRGHRGHLKPRRGLRGPNCRCGQPWRVTPSGQRWCGPCEKRKRQRKAASRLASQGER